MFDLAQKTAVWEEITRYQVTAMALCCLKSQVQFKQLMEIKVYASIQCSGILQLKNSTNSINHTVKCTLFSNLSCPLLNITGV